MVRTVKVKVFLYGSPREVAGRGEVVVSLRAGDTLRDLIQRLGEEFGEKMKEQLQQDSDGYTPCTIVVGGKDYRVAGGLSMKVEDEDEVYLIPVFVGG